MPQIGAQRDDGVGRPKTPAQQADNVQVAQPLTIRHIALAAGDILHVPRIHEEHLEAARLEDLEDRDPVHARGFHGDTGDPTARRASPPDDADRSVKVLKD